MMLLTAEQIETRHGLTARQLKRLRETRQIPYVKLSHRTIRYRESDVEKFIDRHTVRAFEAAE
jgi:predicted DNA-binding transcriptional regulator AlpA